MSDEISLLMFTGGHRQVHTSHVKLQAAASQLVAVIFQLLCQGQLKHR